MIVIQDGTISNGGILLSAPVPIPEGSQVRVSIETIEPAALPPAASPADAPDLAGLHIFGMWADRTDMEDSADYVRREREKWQTRILPRD